MRAVVNSELGKCSLFYFIYFSWGGMLRVKRFRTKHSKGWTVGAQLPTATFRLSACQHRAGTSDNLPLAAKHPQKAIRPPL